MTRTWPLLPLFALLVSPAALALRLPLQSDVDRCALEAQGRGVPTQGHLQLELLLRRSGQVYAAFTRAAGGLDDLRLQRCLSTMATRWEFPEAELDSRRPFDLAMVGGGTSALGRQLRPSVFLPDLSVTAAELPLQPEVAQASLELLEGASKAERGEALLLVGQLEEATRTFRAALEDSPSDPLALRGLSQALIERAGDLREARELAERLQALEPDGAAGHEAMLRLCLAAGDDACAFAEYRAARAAPDLPPRARALAELGDRTREAALRLRLAAATAPPPPCADAASSEDQALCVVRLCLGEGTSAYAEALAQQNGERYRIDAWRTHDAGAGRVVVTRPIVADPGGLQAPGRLGGRHDAVWLVRVADEIKVTPVSPEAHQISASANRCAQRAAAGRTLGTISLGWAFTSGTAAANR